MTAPPPSSSPMQAQAAVRSALAALVLPDATQDDLGPLIARVGEVCESLHAALHGVQAANDPDSAVAETIAAALAAEALGDSLATLLGQIKTARTLTLAAGQATRLALAEALRASGASAVRTRHHACEPVAGAPHVEITDPAALPSLYWRHPEPQPDRAGLLMALREGPVPGARLAFGPATVRIRNRRQPG